MLVLEINYDTIKTMGKFAGIMFGILMLVFLVACLTPWFAKKVDKLKNHKGKFTSAYDGLDKTSVKSVFEDHENDNGDEKNG